MKSLYIEANSGIAGDMFVAAMLDLGADQKVLEEALASIPAKGFTTEISRVQKAGIDCCDFNVILDAEHENHDHDMAYLYGPAPVAEDHHHDHDEEHHHHDHDEEHHHHHDHEEEHHHHDHNGDHHCAHAHEHDHEHHHHHEHRHLADVRAIIDATKMTDSAKVLANKIFLIVAEAESKAHHLPLEEVHFHEVGAIDSIVDIIAAAVTFDNLGITNVIVPALSEGTGTVRCQHGVLPVPVPATLNICETYHMPLTIMDVKGEYVTPTGAAIAAALCTSHELPAEFHVEKVGLGAGKRAYTERANILRALLIDDGESGRTKDEIVKLETDIDDATGEALGYCLEALLKAGALDAHYSPIFMKKNRPAWELTVLCKADKVEALEDVIFRNTTTIGIREIGSVMRSILPRDIVTVETAYGTAKAKKVTIGSEVRFYPEYEAVRALAEEKNVPFGDVYDAVKAAAK